MSPSHIQNHIPTCTMPLLSRCLGTCLVLPAASTGQCRYTKISAVKPRQKQHPCQSAEAKFALASSHGAWASSHPRLQWHPWSKMAPFYNTTAASHKAFPISASVWKLVRQRHWEQRQATVQRRDFLQCCGTQLQAQHTTACRKFSRHFLSLSFIPDHVFPAAPGSQSKQPPSPGLGKLFYKLGLQLSHQAVSFCPLIKNDYSDYLLSLLIIIHEPNNNNS